MRVYAVFRQYDVAIVVLGWNGIHISTIVIFIRYMYNSSLSKRNKFQNSYSNFLPIKIFALILLMMTMRRHTFL